MAGNKDNSLTSTEAAVVSRLPVRDVNRAIDEKIIPKSLYRVGRSRTRRFDANACVFMSFYFGTAEQLTKEERMRTIAAASLRLREESADGLDKEWIVRREFLSIDLAPFLRGVKERLALLASARMVVVEDADILGGIPVIRGTRIPVHDVAASVAAAMPAKRILAAYPGLTAEALPLAALYAQANPQRGRPHRATGLPQGATVTASRREARRMKPQ